MTRRAILSVYDKTGLVEFARELAELGFELVASGGTARALSAAGLPVTSVDQVTGHPEILGGRVKTLHPAIHGGILARRTPEHLTELAAHGIIPVDLVVCNLYPFAATVAKPGVTEAEAVEEIDIGGVTLLRAAAKNFEAVTVVCDPVDYDGVLKALREAAVKAEVKAEAASLDLNLSLDLNRRLALKAFRHTAAYDAAIATWLAGQVGAGLAPATDGQAQGLPLPDTLILAAERVQQLRYGENPHQQAALYRWVGTTPAFEQLQGKELSYNNLVDLEAAWAMPQEFSEPAVAIIKHTNPSGLAAADALLTAYRLAFACDPISAYGSIIAANRVVDLPFVQEFGKLFVEVLAAPGYTEDALAWLAAHKKNCRVMLARSNDFSRSAARETAKAVPTNHLVLRSIAGGLLAQTPDDRGVDESAWQVVSTRQPTEAERRSLAFAWLAVKHVKSNAIVFVQGTATVGVGAGQMNRVDSAFLAARRAGERAKGAVMASDALIPFPDTIEVAAAAGVTACIQPGSALRDDEVLAAADRAGMAMVFTGERHFRH
jgi:phosphoribosylaminoimidazolecarboxamide formyltransferase/IMP cyclohydrolase